MRTILTILCLFFISVVYSANTGFLSPGATGETYDEMPYNKAYTYVATSDNTYSYALYSSSYPIDQDYYNFGLTSVDGTVDSIQIKIEAAAEIGTIGRIAVEVSKDGGSNYTSAGNYLDFNQTTPDQTKYIYGGLFGTTWSASDFADANFRLRITLTQQSGTPYTISIDLIQVNVYYTPSSTSYNPITGKHVRFYANGVEVRDKPRPSGFKYWKDKGYVYSRAYYDIAHQQNAIVEPSASVNDLAVEINQNRNWVIKSGLTYTKIGGSDLFSISDSTLRVAASLTAGSYYVKYLVSDGTYTDTARINILVPASGDCYYVSGSGGGTNSGTKANPYTDLNFTYVTGKYYFFSRGTTITKTTREQLAISNVVLAAYGTGARPIIRNTTSSIVYGNGVPFMYLSSVSGVTIRDIEIYDIGGADAIFGMEGTNTDFTMDNVKLTGTVSSTFNGIRFSTGSLAGGSIVNCQIHHIYDDAVYFHSTLMGTATDDMFEFTNNFIHTVNYAGTSGGGDGIDMGVGDHRYFHIANNKIDKRAYANKHGILYGSTHINGYEDCDAIVENNLVICRQDDIYQNGISFYTARNAICRNNVVYNGNRNIFTASWGLWSTYNLSSFPWVETDWDARNRKLHIYGNLFITSYYAGMDFEANCDSSEAYNNTFVNYGNGTNSSRAAVIVETGCTVITLQNNIFHSINMPTAAITGTSITEDYNLFYPVDGTWNKGAHSLEGNPTFITGQHSSYEINSTSPAYHTGTDLDLTYDLWSDPFDATTPSMGYKEYVQ